MYDLLFAFFGDLMMCRRFGDAEFVLDFNPKLPHSFDGNRLAMVFMAVNGKQQIRNEARQNLNHQAVLTSCNQMVNSQMAFPPGKEVFDVPSELIDLSWGDGNQLNDS